MANRKRIYIEKSDGHYPELKYIITILYWHFGDSVDFVDSLDASDCSVGTTSEFDVIYNKLVLSSIIAGENLSKEFIEGEGVFYTTLDRPDWLVSAFYMLTCAQELGNNNKDEFGRFRYKDSFQSKLNCNDVDLVSKCFEQISVQFPKLGLSGRVVKCRKRLFLSHDIDLLYGSLKQDGFSCLKRNDFRGLFNVVFSHFFGQPLWMNMADIIEVERKFNYKSTFFWLPVYGKSILGVQNADYRMSDKRVQNLVNMVNSNGWESGLHKSISNLSCRDEISLIDGHVNSNRYHFLAFNPHRDLVELEKAGIEFDSSISFAEFPAYRAGYSRPYKPYLLKERRLSKVVESPMHIMDTTFYNYMKVDPFVAKEQILSFVGSSNSAAVIGLLWHNNFYSKYKYGRFKQLYDELLNEFSNSGIECVNSMTIVKEVNYEL
jgi:hypothetical protein